MISKGKSSVTLKDITSKVSEGDILFHYLGVNSVPKVINSPLRKDNKPSFGLYSPDGKSIRYKDLSTLESGGLFDLLEKLWGLDFMGVLEKINKDLPNINSSITVQGYKCSIQNHSSYHDDTDLQCKVRDWRKHDIEYWESYGIPLEWLKYAEVYPISHKLVIKNGRTFVFGADKYAYAFVERKEGKITLKLYQPFNKNGYKWANKHDSSVISLWTKVPETGDRICLCSSLKDALCLWVNTGIPAIAPQGEGYTISDTAINELKKRYKHIYILYDNDEAGLKDAELLSEYTGFTNIVLPNIDGCKDISDLYKHLNNKQEFTKTLLSLFN